MSQAPSPALIFDTLNAYQRTHVLKAAIELNLFTAIGEGTDVPEQLAIRCHASAKGIRILCDYLTIAGFLEKLGGRYHLTPDTAFFLDRRSPAYMGGVTEFLNTPTMMSMSADTAGAVRKGGTMVGEAGTMDPDHPVWVDFARAMMPMMFPSGKAIAEILAHRGKPTGKVLDIAAGHGIFGISVAQRFPEAQITALDWAAVLAVAKENAAKFGVGSRLHTIEGSVFDSELGTGWDVVLVTNFYHHFDSLVCTRLARRIHQSLAPGGCMVTLEMVPNEDRVTPPSQASFSLMMLVTTAHGDAYTFSEYDGMFREAGFSASVLHELPAQRVIVSEK